MSRWIVAFGIALAVGLGFGQSVRAQEPVVVTDTLSEVLFELYDAVATQNLFDALDFADLLGRPDLVPANLSANLANDLTTPAILTGAIQSQLSTFPLGSSAGGFTYTFDASTGAFNRASDSFGPLFAERALTLGRNRFNAGINYQRATFDRFEDKDLSNGEVVFFSEILSPLGDTDDVPFLYSQNTLNLELSTDTVGLFATYGVMDNLDVGIAVPIVSVDLSASVVNRLFFFDGDPFLDDLIFQGGGSATGIGDITVRGKYKLLDLAGGGLAAAVDLRLPTGDEEELLGVPGTQTEVFLIMSTAVGRIAPHFNVGYTFSSGEDQIGDESNLIFFTGVKQPDEFNLTGGVDVAVTSQVTVAADVLVRTLRGFPDLAEGASEVGPGFPEFVATTDAEGMVNERNLNLSYGSVGVKINPWGTLIFSANVLFPLVENGLQDTVMPMFGGDFSF